MTASADPAPPATLPALREDGIRLLTALEPDDAREERVRSEMLDHLAAHPDAWWRLGPPQHFTASVIVLSRGLDRALLTHHRKARTWFQLGGHAEAGDTTVAGAAQREGREESGLPGLEVHPRLVDIDRHLLGEGFSRCREHLDLRFAAVVDETDPLVSDESLDVAWWPVADLPDPHGEELPRLITNARRRLG